MHLCVDKIKLKNQGKRRENAKNQAIDIFYDTSCAHIIKSRGNIK